MSPPRGRRSSLVIVAATAGLALVVAFASRSAALTSSGRADNGPLQVLADAGLYLFMVLLAVGFAVTIWALWPSHLPKLRRPRRWWEFLLPYVGLAVLFAIAALVVRDPGAVARLQDTPLARLLRSMPLRPETVPSARASSGPDWAAIVLVAVVIAAVLAFAAWQWRAARRHRLDFDSERPARELDQVLERELTALADDGPAPLDPRAAVIAAWAGFERVLGQRGLGARAQETPLEYLARALADARLALDPAALRRFTDLFEWARYSTNPVTPAMRAEALATLQAVRDGLRVRGKGAMRVAPA